MSQNDAKVLGWGTIIAILVGVAAVAGMLLGLLGDPLHLPSTIRTGGVGVAVGVVWMILLAGRRVPLGRRKNR